MKVKLAGYTITNVATMEADGSGKVFHAPRNKFLWVRGHGIVGIARSVRIYDQPEGMIHSYNWRKLRHKASGFSLHSPETRMTWYPSRQKFAMYLGKVARFKVNGKDAEIGDAKNWVILRKNGSWIYRRNRCQCHSH